MHPVPILLEEEVFLNGVNPLCATIVVLFPDPLPQSSSLATLQKPFMPFALSKAN